MRQNFLIARILALSLLATAPIGSFAQSPAPLPTNYLELLLRSEPPVDVSTPVAATVSFDPPAVQPGERSVYRLTLNAIQDSVQWPTQITSLPPTTIHETARGEIMRPAAGGYRPQSSINYEFRAPTNGDCLVPGFTINVNGKPVDVPEARLLVSRDAPEPDPGDRLQMEASATNLYLGQTLPVRVLLLARGGIIQGLQQVQLIGDGFLVNKGPSRQMIEPVDRDGRRILSYIYETSVTPIVAGQLTLSAQGFTAGREFSGTITISGPATIPGGAPQYTLITSDPTQISVRPLPPNPPPGFNGIIGKLIRDAPQLSTNRVRVGDPVQLTVVLRIPGDRSRLTPPAPPRSSEWQTLPPTPIGPTPGVVPGTAFAYTLIPLNDRIRETPAIALSYFDPDTQAYADLTIPPVPVTILPDEAATTPVTAPAAFPEPEPERKPSLSGLAMRPGRSVGSLVPPQMRHWFLFVQLSPLCFFAGIWLWDRRRRFLEAHPEIVRRREALRQLRRERRLLRSAAQRQDVAGFVRSAVNALKVACAPHYPANPKALVAADILNVLSAPEQQGRAGDVVRRLFATADAEQFATSPAQSGDLLALHQELEALLRNLEQELSADAASSKTSSANGRMARTVLPYAALAAVFIASHSLAATDDSFQNGLDAYNAGQFSSASDSFQQSVRAKPASGALLNLGLAQWRQGHVGEAVLAWERALWVDPLNFAARNNLKVARDVADLDAPDLGWHETASTWLAAADWAWFTGISLWLAVGMMIAPTVLRWRRRGWHQAVVAVALGIFLLSLPPYVGTLTRSRIGFITAKNVDLRMTPTENAEVVSPVASGQPGREIRRQGTFVLVQTGSGSGWVKEDQFTRIAAR